MGIEVVKEYVYLGVTFYCTGKFDLAIQKQIKQANKAMHALIWRSKKLNLKVDLVLDLFDKCVLQVLLHGSEVWGFSNLEPLEKFYRKFIKKILMLKSSTPNNMVYGESGCIPIEGHVLSRMVGFWCRLLQSNSSKLSRMMYNIARSAHYDRNSNLDSDWCSTLLAKRYS